jgi:surface antigen
MGRGDGRIYGAAIGAILGAFIGNKVGKSMDDRDRMLMQRNTQSALEHQKDHQATAWRNPNTGHSGTIVPQNVYKNRYGQDCREFQQTITVGGKTEQAYGRACRDSNNQWKIVP